MYVIIIYLYVYIVTLYAFLIVNVTVYKFNDNGFKISLYLNFLQIFYGLTMKPKV